MQSVTGLSENPGVASSIPARSHTLVETDHELISKAILLLLLVQEGLLSVTWENMYMKYLLPSYMCESGGGDRESRHK